MDDVKPENPDLHIFLYRVREAQGWSLREAAERAGISFSRLGEIERGRDSHSGKPFVPSYVTLCRLAAAYGLPPAELLRRAGHQPGPELTAEEWRMLDAFRQLSASRRAELTQALADECTGKRRPQRGEVIALIDQLPTAPGAALPLNPAVAEPEDL